MDNEERVQLIFVFFFRSWFLKVYEFVESMMAFYMT